MKTLSDMLRDPEASGIYLLEESHPAETLEKLIHERGVAFFHIEGQDISGKNQFLKQAALMPRFREYFCNNGDAFATATLICHGKRWTVSKSHAKNTPKLGQIKKVTDGADLSLDKNGSGSVLLGSLGG